MTLFCLPGDAVPFLLKGILSAIHTVCFLSLDIFEKNITLCVDSDASSKYKYSKPERTASRVRS